MIIKISGAPGLIFRGGYEFGKNKHFLRVFGGDKEVRLSKLYG
jgi:hypothetical protein